MSVNFLKHILQSFCHAMFQKLQCKTKNSLNLGIIPDTDRIPANDRNTVIHYRWPPHVIFAAKGGGSLKITLNNEGEGGRKSSFFE